MHDDVEIDNYGTLKASEPRALPDDFKQNSLGSRQADDIEWKQHLQQTSCKPLSPVIVKYLQNIEKCKQMGDSLNRHCKNEKLHPEV